MLSYSFLISTAPFPEILVLVSITSEKCPQLTPEYHKFSPNLLPLCLGPVQSVFLLALMEMDEHCFTKNALLVLINDGNLSADSQPCFFQPTDNKLTCEEHGDVSSQTLHSSDGEMKRGEHTSSISSLESSRLRERLSHFSSRAGPPVRSERRQ